MGHNGHPEASLSNRLKKPWVAAALTTTALVVATWALLLGDGAADPGSESLTPLSPSGAEVTSGAGFVVLLFLALWAVLWLVARSKSRASHVESSATE